MHCVICPFFIRLMKTEEFSRNDDKKTQKADFQVIFLFLKYAQSGYISRGQKITKILIYKLGICCTEIWNSTSCLIRKEFRVIIFS